MRHPQTSEQLLTWMDFAISMWDKMIDFAFTKLNAKLLTEMKLGSKPSDYQLWVIQALWLLSELTQIKLAVI
jgi:hypothetical protein